LLLGPRDSGRVWWRRWRARIILRHCLKNTTWTKRKGALR